MATNPKDPIDLTDDLDELFEDPARPKVNSGHYSEDLTLLEPEPAEPAEPVGPVGPTEPTKTAAGDKRDEPVDESLYDELMGKSYNIIETDDIDNLYDEVMAMPDEAPAADIFSEPVLIVIAGKRFEADLAEPFAPHYPTITLHPDPARAQNVFDIQDIDIIGLRGMPANLADLGSRTVSERIDTIGGQTHEVEVPVEQTFETGIFCQARSTADRFPYFFIPAAAIRFRCRTTLFGEMLIEKNLVERSVLDKALGRQKKMRSLHIGSIITKRYGLTAAAIDEVLAQFRQQDDKRKLTGEILVQAGLITDQQLKGALKVQAMIRNKMIGEILIESGHLTEEQVYTCLAEKFRMPYVDLETFNRSKEVDALLDKKTILKLMVLPLRMDNGRLLLATSHPEITRIPDILRKQLSVPFDLAVAVPSLLKAILVRKYSN